MISMEEYDCLVLGDEPAGHWMLQQLESLYLSESLAPRVGWIELSKEHSSLPVPQDVAKRFEIEAQSPWDAQVLTPHDVFLWNEANLEKRFPTSKRSVGLSHLNPDLLFYSSAIWKFMGRAESLHTKTLLEGALQVGSLQLWEPSKKTGPAVISLADEDNPVEISEIDLSKKERIVLKFSNGKTIIAKYLVWNSTVKNLFALVRAFPTLEKLVPTQFESLAQNALYPLRVRVESKAIGEVVPPLCLLMETDNIPDVQKEIWPLQVSRGEKETEITIWVSARQPLSLEELEERNLEAMAQLQTLFPFLSRHLIHVSVPLSFSCLEQTQRMALMERIEESAIEHYQMASFDCRSRHPGFFLLLPSLKCQLPYPSGTLEVAEKLVEQFVGAQRWKTYKNRPDMKKALQISP